MGPRVLHVLDHSWPIVDGYAQRSRSIVNAQSQIGMSPSVLTGPLHQQDDPAGTKDALYEGIQYLRTEQQGVAGLAIKKHWLVLRELSVIRLLTKRIAAVAKSGQFELVHAHSPALCGMAAAMAARSCRLPLVYEIRAFWEDAAVDQNKDRESSLRYRLSRRLETHVVRRASAVVGISRALLKDLEGRGVPSEKLFHVPNGVDVTRFSSRPRDAALVAELGLNGLCTLGFLGTLFPWEGISWLTSAVQELRRRGVHFKLLLVGDGADAPNVKSAIANAGASGYVSFIGRVPNDQVERYYSLMDVMVYPRRSARLTELVTPLKPLEAMALGKPILGSRVGGICELVEPDVTGLLFTPGDVDDFCNQAARLLADAELRGRLGRQAAERIVEQKDWKTLAQNYERVYAFAKSRRL